MPLEKRTSRNQKNTFRQWFAEEAALKKRMEEKSREFAEKGNEIDAKP